MTDNPEIEPGPNLTLLKWVVGILGFLIILFVGIIVVTLYMRMTASESDNPVASVSAGVSSPVPDMMAAVGTATPLDFGTVTLAIPDDMDIISLSSDGARMFLTLGTEGAARRILVISLADGRELGSFVLDKAASEYGAE